MGRQGQPLKIAISIPCGSMVDPLFMRAIAEEMYKLGRDYPQYQVALLVQARREQFRGRNQLVEKALASDVDFIFFLDDDMILSGHTLVDMLKTIEEYPKIKFLGALYWHRNPPYKPVACVQQKSEKGHDLIRYLRAHELDRKKPQKVDVVGGGAMLISTEVFKKIPAPYFWIDGMMGTDIQLCRKAQNAGFDIWLDSRIELGHLTNPKEMREDTLPEWAKFVNHSVEDAVLDARGFLNLDVADISSRIDIACMRDQVMYMAKPPKKFEDVLEYYRRMDDDAILREIGYLNERDWQFDTPVNKVVPADLQRYGIKRALDYGPGIGQITLNLAAAGVKVTACDIPTSRAWAFTKYRLWKHGYDATTIDLKDELDFPEIAYDLIVAMGVLDHCLSPEAVLEKMLMNLRHGGLLIADFNQLKDEVRSPQHVINYDLDKVNAMLDRYGMKPIPGMQHTYIKEG